MFRLLLYLKGYYFILVSGYGTERFINLCKVKNIYLWDMQMNHNEYSMKISRDDYENLEEIVYKTGVKVDILKKYGLPFLFKGKKNRFFYLIFLGIAIALVFISNLFVWQIEYEGNYTVTSEQLSDFLVEYDVDEGVLKSKVSFELLEESLRKEFPVIKWCSVALSGNTLFVRIEENSLLKDEEQILNEFVYSDIVAQEDGVVTKLMIRNGLATVKVGDTVTKGQILVTGAVPIYDDSLLVKNYHYYDADADIAIETTITYEESIDNVYLKKEYTGRSKATSYLKIKNTDIHLPFNPHFAYYDTYTTAHQLSVFESLYLPVYYGSYEAREYYLVEQKYTEEEVIQIFNKKLSNYYARLIEKGVQILEKDVKIEHNASKWVMKGNFVVSICNLEKEYRNQVENFIQ